MLQYDRIDILEGIYINKSNKLKKCIIFHYWYSLSNSIFLESAKICRRKYTF